MESYQGKDKEDERIHWMMFPLSTKFDNNNLITKFNELKIFTGVTQLTATAFRLCTQLETVDCRNISSFGTGDPQTWRNCYSMTRLVLSKIGQIGYQGSINASRSILYNANKLKRLILPSVATYRMLSDTAYPITLTMLDMGGKLVNFCNYSSSSYNSLYFGINGSTTVVIRRATPATGNTRFINPIRKLYVPESSLNDWKASTSFSGISSYIFAIGGAEWIAEFGSADEYANLTEQEYADTYGWLAEQE